MERPAFTLRAMTDADDAGLTALLESAPDTGAVRLRVHHRVPVTAALLRSRLGAIGVVAEIDGRVVGAGTVSETTIGISDDTVPAGYLNALAVAPEYRRRGIARALAEWRIARMRERFGPDVALIAGIQVGNEGSIANARHWSSQMLGPIVIGGQRIRPSARGPDAEWDVGPATESELELTVERLNAAHADHALWAPLTTEALRTHLGRSPVETPVRHVWVARDRAGRPLAGAILQESFTMIVREIVSVPRPLQVADAVLRLLPPDRIIATIDVGATWFSPGRQDAARALLAGAAWAWRGRATHLGFTHDARGHLGPLLPSGPFAATSRLWVAVSTPRPVREDRPLALPLA